MRLFVRPRRRDAVIYAVDLIEQQLLARLLDGVAVDRDDL